MCDSRGAGRADGVEFRDHVSGQRYFLILTGKWAGWLWLDSPRGLVRPLRKATAADWRTIDAGMRRQGVIDFRVREGWLRRLARAVVAALRRRDRTEGGP